MIPRLPPSRPLVPAVTLGVVMCVLGFAFFAHQNSQTSGSVSEWVSALSTLGAFVAAAVAAIFATAAFKLERERDYGAILDRRASQASGVAAWYGVRVQEPKHPRGREAWVAYVSQTGVYLRNASDLPVTNVAITSTWPTGEVIESAIAVLPPAIDPVFHPFSTVPGVEPPKDGEPDVGIEFLDSAGLRWFRRSDGRLLEIDGSVE